MRSGQRRRLATLASASDRSISACTIRSTTPGKFSFSHDLSTGRTASDSFSPTLSSAPNGLSQQEVLQHKLSFSRDERATADLAGWLADSCFRHSFDFDDFIKRFALGACRWIECASSHEPPPKPGLLEQERSHTLLYVGIFGGAGERINNRVRRGAFLIMTENK
jgi:hypothetical protein